MIKMILIAVSIALVKIIEINCHGRLLSPPARSSAWRFDRKFPQYLDDNQMFCGGFDTQWRLNGLFFSKPQTLYYL